MHLSTGFPPFHEPPVPHAPPYGYPHSQQLSLQPQLGPQDPHLGGLPSIPVHSTSTIFQSPVQPSYHAPVRQPGLRGSGQGPDVSYCSHDGPVRRDREEPPIPPGFTGIPRCSITHIQVPFTIYSSHSSPPDHASFQASETSYGQGISSGPQTTPTSVGGPQVSLQSHHPPVVEQSIGPPP